MMLSIGPFFAWLGAIAMIGGLVTECVALIAMSHYGLAKNARWKVIGFILFYVGAAVFVVASVVS